MDEQEDEADHQPDDWEGVEDALEESSQVSGLSSRLEQPLMAGEDYANSATARRTAGILRLRMKARFARLHASLRMTSF
jgi:hypothetical protein